MRGETMNLAAKDSKKVKKMTALLQRI